MVRTRFLADSEFHHSSRNCLPYALCAGYYYDSQSRLMLDDLPTRYALYECSPACACNMTGTCVNRITQGSFSTPCSVRWTDTRGFGLFAETDIAKGSFLCCYVGEVISTSERKNRWMKQDETKQSNYTLVLREVMQVRNSREVLTTAIDARLKGNIGHFLSKLFLTIFVPLCNLQLDILQTMLVRHSPHTSSYL